MSRSWRCSLAKPEAAAALMVATFTLLVGATATTALTVPVTSAFSTSPLSAGTSFDHRASLLPLARPPCQKVAELGRRSHMCDERTQPRLRRRKTRETWTNMIDPSAAAAGLVDAGDALAQSNNLVLTSAAAMSGAGATSGIVGDGNLLLSFADQGQNLAGIFFQASLLPYLVFLYFLQFRGNRTPALGNFGFQFLLLFVLSTIPGGIISKGTYGVSLADCDWLHGSAEALLTVTNLLIVLGFAGASTKEGPPPIGKPRLVALGCFGAFVAAAALGTTILGFKAHSPFLFGIGGLTTGATEALPWVSHNEPVNALSLPTWAIHFSSVYEFLFAMGVIWNYANVTDNPKWKGMTWGMLPLHASGIAACTYHFFYNPSTLQFLVTTQAGLTLLGNITVAIAAYRIARSNGWTVEDLNPLPRSATSPVGLVTDSIAVTPLKTQEAKQSKAVLVAQLVALTLGTSYLVKYGELGLDLPFEANPAVAVAVLLTPPLLTGYNYWNRSKQESGEGAGIDLSSLFGGGGDGKEGLSMEDVKKYGVAGTVAYVLTELAFWAVAFPVASYALYESSGHWPDVVNDAADRATVLGFIFAGANIARLAVPLRLGAALALAPWVDENIINRQDSQDAPEEA